MSTSAALRRYLYTVNSHGSLFLSETPHKNYASQYREIAFLDFFLARVRPVQPKDDAPEGYAWVVSPLPDVTLASSSHSQSPCGVELNFMWANYAQISRRCSNEHAVSPKRRR